MPSLTPVSPEIKEKLLQALQLGLMSSCEAVQWLLPKQYVESYRRHSKAREMGYGFEDIPYRTWHLNYSKQDKTHLRMTRVRAWLDYLEHPPATQEIPPFSLDGPAAEDAQ